MPARRSRSSSKLRTAVSLAIEITGLLVQLALVYLGVRYLMIDDDELAEHGRLLAWCMIATLYLLCTVIWLNVDLRLHRDDPPLMRKFSASRPTQWLTTLVSLTTSLVGLSAAVTLIFTRGEPDHLAIYELIAVWAMLVSWAMFQWSYARIYYALYHRDSAVKPLQFHGTDEPRIIDFVYFAFTNATSFAPGDVAVTTSRMRWTVVWHTTLSFFFNALIIVLTMNTISGGFQGV